MRLRVLGPVEVLADGRTVGAGPPQRCAVLAALAVDAGRSVPMEVLMDRVWGAGAPQKARRSVHTHIARIRQLLEQSNQDPHLVPVVRQGGGYTLKVDPDRVDLHRFRGLLSTANEHAHSDEQKASLLRQALDLWHGQPLAGVPGQWAARVREAWQNQRIDAVVALAQAELRLGNPFAVIGILTDLVDQHPLVESLTAMLMRAHHAAGRDAQALDCYTTIRRHLVQELGVDPGTELQHLHQAILRGDLERPAPAASPRQPHITMPHNDVPVSANTATATGPIVPRQVPASARHFVGRTAELKDLIRLAGEAAGNRGPTVITAIAGSGGIGKTALALHLAHMVADKFPDGQLYINLRGFDPSGSPTAPAEAIRLFLDSFGLAKERIPLSLDAKASLYRSLIAHRRLLIILDNVCDPDQVRPLLPGTPGCMVVVTSRNQLTGLIAGDGAHPITLDLLNHVEAADLLTQHLGPERIASEPQAVDDLITGCARLPLALSIVASRAAVQPTFPLGRLAAELTQEHQRLDALDTNDRATQLRAVFSWSYQQLRPPAARLFRLLGVHPGPDLTVPAAASLTGASILDTRHCLGELTKAHLLSEHKPGRYTLHDLLRAYAAELTHAHDHETERRNALHRTFDHYLHTAHIAAARLSPHQEATALAPPQPAVTIEDIGHHEQALAWLEAEYPVLLATIRRAHEAQSYVHVAQLAWTLTEFFDRRGRWHDWATTQELALEAASRLNDPISQARTHRSLGRAHHRLERHDDALRHHYRARDTYAQIGDHVGEAHSHINLARSFDRLQRHGEALNHVTQALELYTTAGHKAGQASALNNIGWFHNRLSNHRQALAYCQQALAIHQELGNREGEANTWNSLGYIHHHLGQDEQAVACYHRSVNLHHDLGDRFSGAVALTHMGDAHRALGDIDSACDAWQRALEAFKELGHPEADQVQAKLIKP